MEGRWTNVVLSASTLAAALFVALQTWVARDAYMDAQKSRLLENKLDLCFDAFEMASDLDMTLRKTVPASVFEGPWPPKIVLDGPETLENLQYDVVPRLNSLQTGLIKASILGELDKHRAYLVQQLNGLSKQLLDLVPARLGDDTMDSETDAVLAVLSEFLGAQYSVLTGCRLVAEGKA